MSEHECPKYENQICCLRHQRDALRARVRELEAELFEWQSMEHNKEITRLREALEKIPTFEERLRELLLKGKCE